MITDPGNKQPGPAPVQITCVEDMEALWPRAGEWNQLVRHNRTDTVFQTFEWQVSWCRAFGDQVKLLVLLAETEDGLVGIAPLMISERRLGRNWRVLEFVGGDAADYCDFILASADIAPLFLEWLAENGHRWDVLNLSNIAETSPLLECLPPFFRVRGKAVDLRLLYECPTRLLVDREQDLKVLKKKSIKRHENYFLRSGALEFRNCGSIREAYDQLEPFFEQHVQRWSQAGFPSQFLDARCRDFYRQLVDTMMPSGEVRFSVLSFDQKPIAFHFGFEYGNRVYWILPSFDPAYADHSPGEVLLKHCMEDAVARGVGEFDFTVGEEQYKYRYANHVRRAYRARVYRYRVLHHVDRLQRSARARVRQWAAHLRTLQR